MDPFTDPVEKLKRGIMGEGMLDANTMSVKPSSANGIGYALLSTIALNTSPTDGPKGLVPVQENAYVAFPPVVETGKGFTDRTTGLTAAENALGTFDNEQPAELHAFKIPQC
jgi:hypothetical protein